MNTININNSLFFIIDVQEKLVAMLNEDEVRNSSIKLAKIAKILNIPTIITEQYPKGLGSTIIEVKENLSQADFFEKTYFDALKDEKILNAIKSYNKKQIIIFGIETHICVLQTAFNLLNKNYEVFVVKNACGSRNSENKEIALKRMERAGAQIVTEEMVLFELLESSKHPNFKEVQNLIK